LPSLLYPDKLGSLQSFPRTVAGSMGWVPEEEERRQEKRGGEILEVGKGGMWQNGSELKIRNRDEIRENIMDGMDKGVAYTERTSE